MTKVSPFEQKDHLFDQPIIWKSALNIRNMENNPQLLSDIHSLIWNSSLILSSMVFNDHQFIKNQKLPYSTIFIIKILDKIGYPNGT